MKKLALGILSLPTIRRLRHKHLPFTCSIIKTKSELRDFCRFKKIEYGSGIYNDEFLDDRILVTARYYDRIIGHTSIGKQWERVGVVDYFSGGTWVHPIFRGIGIGSSLLGLSIEEATRRQMLPVLGNINHDNDHSLSMCKKSGFVVVEEPELSAIIEKCYAWRFGSSKRQIIVKYDPHQS